MRSDVRELLRDLGIRPSKKLGQNFLVDDGVLDSIEQAIAATGASTVIEIGPGLGAVTQRLISPGRRVIGLEVDHRLAEALTQRLAAEPTVEIRDQDALAYDLCAEHPNGDVVLFGSIPYSLTASILKYVVEHRGALREAILVTQKEVALKVAASPGKEGTSLGVLVRAYADVELLRHIGREVFLPVPDVDSTLWRMRFLETPRFTAPEGAFFSIVRTVYQARRKMLRRALRQLESVDDVDRLLTAAGLDGEVRGEVLGFAELDRLAHALNDLHCGASPR